MLVCLNLNFIMGDELEYGLVPKNSNSNFIRDAILDSKEISNRVWTTKILPVLSSSLSLSINDKQPKRMNFRRNKKFHKTNEEIQDQQNSNNNYNQIVIKKGKTFIRIADKKGGYYTRPCLVNVISCYFFDQ